MADLTAQYRVNMDSSGIGSVDFNGGAGGQNVNFYYRAVPDVEKSNLEGRPVSKNIIYVECFAPGEAALNVVRRPATHQDAHIWPRQWALFQQNKDQVPEGTHIEMLYPTDPAKASTLRANGIHTIEQLAHLSGEGIARVGMGAQTWVNEAQAYINHAKSGAGLLQLRNQIESLERDKNALEHKLNVAIEEINRMKSGAQNMGQPGTLGAPLTLADVQKLIAQSQQQPAFPTQQWGQNMLTPDVFDQGTAQINATHPSQEVKPKSSRKKL